MPEDNTKAFMLKISNYLIAKCQYQNRHEYLAAFNKFIDKYGPYVSTILFYNWGKHLISKTINDVISIVDSTN